MSTSEAVVRKKEADLEFERARIQVEQCKSALTAAKATGVAADIKTAEGELSSAAKTLRTKLAEYKQSTRQVELAKQSAAADNDLDLELAGILNGKTEVTPQPQSVNTEQLARSLAQLATALEGMASSWPIHEPPVTTSGPATEPKVGLLKRCWRAVV